MDIVFTIIMYILWILSIIGLLVITFSKFQFVDLNVIVGVLVFFTLVNSFLTITRGKSKRVNK